METTMMQPRHPKEYSWNSPRWRGIIRPYTHADVDRLRGSIHIEYTLARSGAEKFWKLLRSAAYLPALGAVTGQQVVEMAQAGLKAIHLSGCQFAPASIHGTEPIYPGQGLYPANSVAAAVRSMNHALLQADRVSHGEGRAQFDWMLPIVTDGDAGFGDSNTFESTTAMIEAGAAAIQFDDQLPSARKCGHLDGKVLVPTGEAIQKLVAARLAADTMGVPTVLIARTDARSADSITNGYDARDRRFLLGERNADGRCAYRGGLQAAIARALAYAPYADLLLCEMPEPNVHEAREFANAIHAQFPGKMLAYNCSPAFQWRTKLNEDDIDCFQRDLAAMGYRFQFVPLAGFHALKFPMYALAKDYAESGMTAYSRLQLRELEMAEDLGYSASQRRRPISRKGYFHAQTTRAATAALVARPALSASTQAEGFEVDILEYNDGEATERTPLPHLYPLLESMPLSSSAAND
jgi:isocitrate lyase